MESESPNHIKRLALGRDFGIGSLYSTVNDTFLLDIGSIFKDKKHSIRHEMRDSVSLNIGKILGDKVKSLIAQPELEFSILTEPTNMNNQFIEFLRFNDYHFGNVRMKRVILKLEFEHMKHGLDWKKNYSLYEPRWKLLNFNELFVVTEVTYGLQIVAVFSMVNLKNLDEEEFLRNFNLIADKLKHRTSLDFSDIDESIKTHVKVDFIDNVAKWPYRHLKFDEFIRKFKSSIKSLKSEFGPIEYTMTPYCFFKNRLPTKHADLQNDVFVFYSRFNEHISMLYNKWREIINYSNYYEPIKKESIRKVLKDLNCFERSVVETLRNEVMKIRMNHTLGLDYIKRVIESIIQDINRMENIWISYEPNLNQLEDIKFFTRIQNLIYLEANCDRKDIKLKNGIIFGYSLSLKEQNKEVWKACLGEFMFLMHDQQNRISFYVLNFDVCKPLNFNCFDQIQLMRVENGKITQHLITKNSCQNQNSLDKKTEDVNQKEEYNIVLLGETGVGKSTFVNAFYNYINFHTLENASQSQPKVYLIESNFHYTNDNFKTEKIQIGEATNEVFIEGQSSTQNARDYIFPLNNKIIRIIDTPGMGDSRGHEVDKKNFDNTVEFLSKFSHINAICFLVKPNNPRLHPGFRYCFKELLSHLHKNTTNNIVFCFTNTRSTQYRPGETFGALKAFFSEIEEMSRVKIRFEKDNIFCVDNEAFRFLMLENHGVKFDNNERRNLSISWKNSSESSIRMIDYIMNQLCPLKIKDIILLNTMQQFNSEWAKTASNLFNSLILKKYELFKEKEDKAKNKAKKQKTKWNENEWNSKNDKIGKFVMDALEICSKLCNLMSLNCMSVYNDDFEAYLQELYDESFKRFLVTQKDEKICHFFKEVIRTFQDLKKQVHESIISKQLVFDDKSLNNLSDQLYKIDDELKQTNL